MAMIELCNADQREPLPLCVIAGNCGISLSYLEQLIAGLRKRGFVKSYRGPGGGYVMARPAGEIAIADILAAVEDSAGAKRGEAEGHGKGPHCPHTAALWDHAGGVLSVLLRDVSLADVASGRIGGGNPDKNPDESPDRSIENRAKSA